MIRHCQDGTSEPKRVVVIGARGFIGAALCHALAARGTPVRPLSSADVDLRERDAAALLAAWLRPGDAVVVLAALTPDRGRDLRLLRGNLAMGETLAEALSRVPCAHLVYASSDAVYPFQEAPLTERTCASATDLYGAMHRARELILRKTVSCPVAVLRPTLVYGMGDTHNAYGVMRAVRSALGEQRIALFGRGEEYRDHVWIEDLVRLMIVVLDRRSEGILNVATGASTRYLDLALAVARCIGGGVAIEFEPRRQPIRHRHFDITALRQAFPAFRFTPLQEAIARIARRLEAHEA